MTYDVRAEPHYPLAERAANAAAPRYIPGVMPFRDLVQNILWAHQLAWDDRVGGRSRHQALCADCKWRSGLVEHRWEGRMAHVRHLADLIDEAAVDVICELAADAISDALYGEPK